MSFEAYKEISYVLKEFEIIYGEDDFIKPINFLIQDYILAELEFSLKEVVVDNSEAAICETFIYPILREVWKQYKDQFMLWSHRYLKYDEKLCGLPDYIISQKSSLGKVIFDHPFFIIVEAKQDNFSQGWGQCLAELVAVQKINEQPEQTIFGIVTNGRRWEFGKLYLQHFTKNIKGYNIEELDKIFGSVAWVFEQCRLQLVN
jgi:hypothetical protein